MPENHFLWLLALSTISITLLNTKVSLAVDGVVNLRDDVQLVGEPFASDKYPGSTGYAYYGIRYGTGKRFEASVENTDFTYLKNTTRQKQGNVCPQGFLNGLPPVTNTVFDEDCLYMDVYVPPRAAAASSSGTFPAMLWIHGGGFQVGTKDQYNSTSLADDIGAIIVTINYRLAAYGFLSTGDDSARGDYGIGDCRVAIKFAHKYIEKFGGNANAFSIFGQSGGGGLVSVALLDPVIRGMTYAAIAFSGSVLVDPTVAYIRDPMTNAKKVATTAGCPTDTSAAMISCLKALPQDQFQKAQLTVVQIPINAAFAFVIDHDNLPDLPLRALQQTLDSGYTGPNVITSYLREDAALTLTLSVPDVISADPLSMNAIRDVIAKYLLPRDGRPLCPVPDTALADRVMQHYNLSAADSRNDTLTKFYHLASDAIQGYPAAKEALIYAKHAGPSGPSVQIIRTIYDSHYNGWGAFHALELAYIFGQWQLFPGEVYDPRVTVSYRNMLRQVTHNGRMDGPAFLQSNGAYGVNELGLDAQWSASTYDLAGMLNYWQGIANQPCPGAYTAY